MAYQTRREHAATTNVGYTPARTRVRLQSKTVPNWITASGENSSARPGEGSGGGTRSSVPVKMRTGFIGRSRFQYLLLRFAIRVIPLN